MKEIVAASLALPESERQRFLGKACRDSEFPETEIRREVQALLDVDESAVAFLERSLTRLPTAGRTPLQVGQRLGPYRILDEIARGGMSAVFLAVRADDAFQRQVAIKLLKRGLDTDSFVARFRKERQILANLDHPNIAKMFDGSSTDDGLPYLVMEYIEGAPIDQHCQLEKLAVEQRLALLSKVCSAVHFAHQSLVVHRDLKPSNILVNENGEPKLLDFGVAKVLDEEGGQYKLTAIGTRPMTLPYASPEQVRGAIITTSTDIYSLGVLAYELLCDMHPFSAEERSQDEMVRSILDGEVEKPSFCVERLATTDPDRPPARHKHLAKRLRGDLDQIVLKAMAVEPWRRYRSAERLAADIERHLRGLPVAARPATVTYRFTKLIRRHRGKFLLAAIAFLLLISFTVGMTLQASRIARELDNTERERQRAEQIAAFLGQLFEVSHPSQARGNSITAREILDRGAERIDHELAEQPLLQADLMLTMGRVYTGLGLFDDARDLLEQTLVQHRQVLGSRHRKIADSQAALAELYFDSGELAKSDNLYRSAIGLTREIDGNGHPRLAGLLVDLAKLLHHRGDFNGAESAFEEASAIYAQRRDVSTPELDLLDGFARLKLDQARYADAEALARQALAQRRESLGADHPQIAASLTSLGLILQRKGNYEDAAEHFEQALTLRQQVFGAHHPRVADSFDDLALLRKDMGDYTGAESLLQSSFDLRRNHLGARHPDLAFGFYRLATVLREKAELERAEKAAEEGLEIARQHFGDGSKVVADLNNELAAILFSAGRYEEVEAIYRQSMATLQQLFGEHHPDVAATRHNLALLLHAQNRPQEAEAFYRQALRSNQQTFGPSHPGVAGTLDNLGRLLYEQGDLDAAEPLARQAVAMRRQFLGSEHKDLASTITVLALILRLRGDLEEAEGLFAEALGINRRHLGDDHPHVGVSRNNLALVLHDRQKFAAAEAEYRGALASIEENLGKAHPTVAMVRLNLGRALIDLERPGEAEVLLKQSQRDLAAALDSGHWVHLIARALLGASLVAQGEYVEAEGLLLAAHEGLETGDGLIAQYRRRTRKWLVELYRATGRDDLATAYVDPEEPADPPP